MNPTASPNVQRDPNVSTSTPPDASGNPYTSESGLPLLECMAQSGAHLWKRQVRSSIHPRHPSCDVPATPWTIRQYAGFASAAKSNERYRLLLERGQKGLSVAFDLPTQIGYDSDDPLAEGEVGRVGVPIDDLTDMEALFDGIPLGDVSTSMTINATAPLLLLLYELVAEKQGTPAAQLSGTVQNDILKEYVARGTYIFPPRAFNAASHGHVCLLQ